MPVPDAVHVRVRTTVCLRNLVGGLLHRALTRAVNMTAAVRGGRTGDGFGERPARPLRPQPRATLGVRRGASTYVGWLTGLAGLPVACGML